MNDFIGLLGIGMLGAGISAGYGWEFACIIVGGIFLTIAIIGAARK